MPNYKFKLKSIFLNGYRTIAEDGVLLDFSKSPHVILIGRNGSGKSNILNGVNSKAFEPDAENEPHADLDLPYSLNLTYIMRDETPLSNKKFEIKAVFNKDGESKILFDGLFEGVILEKSGHYAADLKSSLSSFDVFKSSRDVLTIPKPKHVQEMRNVRLSNGRRVNKKVNVSAHGQEKAIESTKILNQITTFFNSVKVSKIDDLSKWYSSLVIIPENFENPDTLMSYIMRKLSAAELANLKMLTNTGKLSHANRSNLVKKINIALKELTKLTSCIDLRLDLSSQLDLSKIQIETNQSEFAVSMSNRSDGERSMIAYLLMLEELNSNSDNGPNIVLFDEIENHLDPKNQEVLSNLIAATATPNLNFIFSTHSPYIFFNKIVRDKLNIYSTKKEINVTKVEKVISGDNFKLNYSSWAEMNFVAYGISSIQYHNELFGQLVMSHGSIPNADQHLFSKDAPIKNYTKSDNNQKPQPVKCNHSGKCIAGHNSPTKYDTTCLTLPAFIRHTTHHPENTLNKEHTRDELKQSIEFLRQHI